MKTIISTTTTLVALYLGYVQAQPPPPPPQSATNPAAGVTLNTPTYEGCYSSAGSLSDQGPYTYQAMGWCQPLCVKAKASVLGFSNGTQCWCGNEVPSPAYKVDDSECNLSCSGYGQDTCGGLTAYAVWNDGMQLTVSTAGGAASTTAPSSTGSSSATVVQVASTVFVTAPGSTSAQVVYTTQTPAASGPNKAAIAAGVIVAVIVVCGIVGGLMIWLRQKNRRELEEEHRRKEAEKPQPSSNSTTSLADARLEPSVMFQRRQSDGSIADNQDYSRRILKVTNPDGRDSRII